MISTPSATVSTGRQPIGQPYSPASCKRTTSSQIFVDSCIRIDLTAFYSEEIEEKRCCCSVSRSVFTVLMSSHPSSCDSVSKSKDNVEELPDGRELLQCSVNGGDGSISIGSEETFRCLLRNMSRRGRFRQRDLDSFTNDDFVHLLQRSGREDLRVRLFRCCLKYCVAEGAKSCFSAFSYMFHGENSARFPTLLPFYLSR